MKKIYNMNLFIEQLEEFMEKEGRFPSIEEIKNNSEWPTIKTIQRRFGGIIPLRKSLNVGGYDRRKGAIRVETFKEIGDRSKTLNAEFYNRLLNFYNERDIHVDKKFGDDKTKCNFYIYNKIIIDVFYAKDKYCFYGCINLKNKKFEPDTMRQYPVYFLCLNKDLDVSELMRHKKNPIVDGVRVMGVEEFFKDM